MTTTTFRNLRSLSQFASVFLILINLPLPFVMVLRPTFVYLEYIHIQMGFRGIGSVLKATSMINITLGLFASCGINSRVKLYMRLYLMTSLILFILLGAMALYMTKAYVGSVLTQMTSMAVSKMTVMTVIEENLSCSFVRGSCRNTVRENAGTLRNYYLAVAFCSIFLNILNFVLLKVATKITIESHPPKLPNFIEKTKVGMNTESLRSKRVISVNSNTSVNSALP